MNMDVLTRLSHEHEELLPIIVGIQEAAEAGDNAALVVRLKAGQTALTDELDAHIVLEEGVAFTLIEKTLGEELVASFRTEHTEIRTLRDDVVSGAHAGIVPVGPCLQLCELIQAHMQREDTMLFPSAYNALDQYTLETS
jgi:hemerythrin-like domain-containing protein